MNSPSSSSSSTTIQSAGRRGLDAYLNIHNVNPVTVGIAHIMLDAFEILTTSGVVLWSKEYAPVSSNVINTLINDVFIEERMLQSQSQSQSNSNSNSAAVDDRQAARNPPFRKDKYTVKWTTAKDVGLIFVAVYQSILHLSWVDNLLDVVRVLFVKQYGSRLSKTSPAAIDCSSFAPTFAALVSKFDTTATAADQDSASTTSVLTPPSSSGGTDDGRDEPPPPPPTVPGVKKRMSTFCFCFLSCLFSFSFSFSLFSLFQASCADRTYYLFLQLPHQQSIRMPTQTPILPPLSLLRTHPGPHHPR